MSGLSLADELDPAFSGEVDQPSSPSSSSFGGHHHHPHATLGAALDEELGRHADRDADAVGSTTPHRTPQRSRPTRRHVAARGSAHSTPTRQGASALSSSGDGGTALDSLQDELAGVGDSSSSSYDANVYQGESLADAFNDNDDEATASASRGVGGGVHAESPATASSSTLRYEERYEAATKALEESVRLTDDFLAKIRNIVTSTGGGGAQAAAADGSASGTATTEDTAAAEAASRNVVRLMHEMALTREQQVAELTDAARQFSRGGVGGGGSTLAAAPAGANLVAGLGMAAVQWANILASLEPLPGLDVAETDMLDPLGFRRSALAAATKTTATSSSSMRGGARGAHGRQEFGDEDEDEEDEAHEEGLGERELGHLGEEDEAEDDEAHVARRHRDSSPSPAPPPPYARGAPAAPTTEGLGPTESSVSVQLSELQRSNSQLVASLAALHEHSQVARAAMSDAARRLRSLRTVVSQWKAELESVERSMRWLDDWHGGSGGGQGSGTETAAAGARRGESDAQRPRPRGGATSLVERKPDDVRGWTQAQLRHVESALASAQLEADRLLRPARDDDGDGGYYATSEAAMARLVRERGEKPEAWTSLVVGGASA